MFLRSSLANLVLIICRDPLYIHTSAHEFPPQHHLIRFLCFTLPICKPVNFVDALLNTFVICKAVCLTVFRLLLHSVLEKKREKRVFFRCWHRAPACGGSRVGKLFFHFSNDEGPTGSKTSLMFSIHPFVLYKKEPKASAR